MFCSVLANLFNMHGITEWIRLGTERSEVGETRLSHSFLLFPHWYKIHFYHKSTLVKIPLQLKKLVCHSLHVSMSIVTPSEWCPFLIVCLFHLGCRNMIIITTQKSYRSSHRNPHSYRRRRRREQRRASSSLAPFNRGWRPKSHWKNNSFCLSLVLCDTRCKIVADVFFHVLLFLF